MIQKSKKSISILPVLSMLVFCFEIFSANVFAQAPQSDPVYDKLINPTSTVSVNGIPIAAGGVIEYQDVKDAGFTFSFSFGAPVLGDNADMLNPTNNPLNKGDSTTQILSTGPYVQLQAGQQSSVQMTNGEVPLGTVSFGNATDASGHTVSATLTFDGDDGIFNGTYNTVSGSFEMKMELTGITQGNEEQNISINIFGNDYTVHVPSTEIIHTLNKTGVYNNDGTITWTAIVNRTQGDSALSLEGFRFEDDLTNAGSYIDGTFLVNSVAQTPTISDNKLTYDFASTGEAQTISYKTAVFDIHNPVEGNNTALNSAKLMEISTLNSVAAGSASVNYEILWIEKSGTSEDDYLANISTTTWSVLVNHLGASLNNVVVTDHLSEGAIVSASYQTGSIQADGSIAWNSTHTPISPNTGTFEYLLGDISTPVLMTITSELDWGVNVFTEKTITNSATLTCDNFEREIQTSANVTVGYNALTKTGSANVAEGTITWKVSVDPKEQSFVNAIVYDVLLYAEEGSVAWSENNLSAAGGLSASELAALTPSYGQALDADTLHETTSTGASILSYAITDSSGEQIGDLIVVTDTDGNGENTLGFTFDSFVLEASYLVGNATNITNTAELYSRNTPRGTATATVRSGNNVIKDTIDRNTTGNTDFSEQVDTSAARRTTSFNYEDQTVVYRIEINANGLVGANIGHTIEAYALGDIVFKDTLPTGWEFVPFDGTVDNYLLYDANANRVNLSASDLSFATTQENGKHVATFTFSEDALRPYTLFLRAKPTDDTVLAEYFGKNGITSIENTVDVYKVNTGTSLGNDTANINISSTLLSKSVAANENTGAVTWTLVYNPNEFASVPSTTTLLDTLSNGIDLRTDSKGKLLFTDENGNANIAIYEMETQADGTLLDVLPAENLANENTVEYDMASRTLTFSIPDSSRAYRYEYITDVTAADGVAHNSVRFSSGNALQISAQYSISQAIASASMRRNQYIRLQSVEQNNESVLLEDTEFTLFSTGEDDITKADPFRTGLTNENGECFMGHLPPGEYILQITKPTSGYHPSSTQYTVSVTPEDITINGEPYSPGDAYPIPSIPIRDGVGNLHVSNTLSGNAADETKDFSYTVHLPSLADGTQIPYVKSDNTTGALIVNNGSASFTLKGGQHIEMMNIPENTDYEVNAADNIGDGYTTSAENAGATILENTTAYTQFTHTKNISDSSSLPEEEIESDVESGSNETVTSNSTTSQSTPQESESDAESGSNETVASSNSTTSQSTSQELEISVESGNNENVASTSTTDAGTPPIPSESEGSNSVQTLGVSTSDETSTAGEFLSTQTWSQDVPQTRDNTNLIVLLLVSFLSVAGLVFCVLNIRYRRNRKKK